MITIIIGPNEGTSYNDLIKSWHFTKKDTVPKDTETSITLPESEVPTEFYSEYRNFRYDKNDGLVNTYGY